MDPKLNPHSNTWTYIRDWASLELDKLREENDVPHDIEYTNFLRGKIKILKELLYLETKKEPIIPDQGGYQDDFTDI